MNSWLIVLLYIHSTLMFGFVLDGQKEIKAQQDKIICLQEVKVTNTWTMC